MNDRRRIWKRAGWSAVALLAAGGAALGWLEWRRRGEPERFGIVEPGKVYRCGQLHPAQLEWVVDTYGIRTLIYTHIPDVSLEDLVREQRLCERRGVRMVSLIMPGDGRGGFEQYDRALELLRDPDRHPVLITCARGTHRTGALVACYRVLVQSWPLKRALAEMERYGFEGRAGWLGRHAEHPLVPHLKAYVQERTGYAD